MLVIMQYTQEKANLQKTKVNATKLRKVCMDRNKIRHYWERMDAILTVRLASFLDTDFVNDVCTVYVCMSLCPPPRLSITSGMIFTPYDWLNKIYSFYTEAAMIIGSGNGLRIEAHCQN